MKVGEKKKKIYKTEGTTGQRFTFGFEFKIGERNGGEYIGQIRLSRQLRLISTMLHVVDNS